jgi:hypothetical protein
MQCLNSFCLCSAYISEDEEIQQKITEELASIGLLATPDCPEPRPLEHADLGKLTYLTAIIKVTPRDVNLP